MIVNCLTAIKEKGYNLSGYNPDTIVSLHDAEGSEDECEALFYYLEATYG